MKEWKRRMLEEQANAGSKKEKEVDSIESILVSAEFGTYPSVDLHGAEDTQDGIAQVDRFLDQLLVAGTPGGKIIHGKGTGAMRTAIHKHLATISYIERFRDVEIRNEQSGATVVAFTQD